MSQELKIYIEEYCQYTNGNIYGLICMARQREIKAQHNQNNKQTVLSQTTVKLTSERLGWVGVGVWLWIWVMSSALVSVSALVLCLKLIQYFVEPLMSAGSSASFKRKALCLLSCLAHKIYEVFCYVLRFEHIDTEGRSPWAQNPICACP